MTAKKTPEAGLDSGDTDREILEAAAARARPSEQDRGSGSMSRNYDETDHFESDRLDNWAPPSMLTLPPDDPQYVYRWVAEYVNGQHMARNMGQARQQGYIFVKVSELPEGFFVDEDTKGDGLARTGGLVMAKIPRRMAAQRRAYYAKRTQESLAGADELQGVAGANSVRENRGTRSLDGRAAGNALRELAQG